MTGGRADSSTRPYLEKLLLIHPIASIKDFLESKRNGRGSRVRTRDLRFWRPSLYQLSYTPKKPPKQISKSKSLWKQCAANYPRHTTIKPTWTYSMISATTPAPTVRPPSRIAKRRPSSIAIGTISSTETATLSPGITISVPSGRVTTPVTSVVRK